MTLKYCLRAWHIHLIESMASTYTTKEHSTTTTEHVYGTTL